MNKQALVTGASRGIGKAIAIKLAKEGYDLHLICQNKKEMLDLLANELALNYQINIHTYAGDVSDSAFVKNIFSNIDNLDVLVNNAGISYVGLLSDMTDEEWHNIVSVNLDSVFFFSREAVKLMLKNHSGNIINISSVWGTQGASMEVAYSATKGGINSFTKALAKELAPSNININAVACGLINTDMNSHLSSDDLNELINEIPADRIGQPDEIADVVLSLIESPSYLTGQIITVDGGWI